MPRLRGRLMIVTLCAGLLPAAAGAGASPGQLFYERMLMSEAGARCRLFTPDIASALAAGTQQARGTALRAGVEPAALATIELRARSTAGATRCASRDLAIAAGRVRTAFSGYARLDRMDFPGDASAWKATRGVNAATVSAWRLAQGAAAPPGRVTFGIAADTGQDRLSAVAGWPGARNASGARLVLRDPTKSPEPYLDTRRTDLGGRIAPRNVSLVFLASGRATAGANLLPTGATSGAVFRFPSAATRAIMALDPREALVVEIVYETRAGERVERIPFEVGDFAAGLAFLENGR